MRILIAEDDDALRERLVAVFSRAFYLPETATNGSGF